MFSSDEMKYFELSFQGHHPFIIWTCNAWDMAWFWKYDKAGKLESFSFLLADWSILLWDVLFQKFWCKSTIKCLLKVSRTLVPKMNWIWTDFIVQNVSKRKESKKTDLLWNFFRTLVVSLTIFPWEFCVKFDIGVVLIWKLNCTKFGIILRLFWYPNDVPKTGCQIWKFHCSSGESYWLWTAISWYSKLQI